MRLLRMVAGKMVRAEWVYYSLDAFYFLPSYRPPISITKMIISNMIALLPLLAVGVFAETSKPNTGDQKLGKSPFQLHSSFRTSADDQDSYSDSQPLPS